MRIFIDPGHGGKDPGACNGKFKEKDIVLDIGLMLGEQLSKEGHEVAYSRTTDSFVSLAERVNKSNRFKADVFISLHCNAFSAPNAQGVETYYYKTSSKGKELAAKIQQGIIDNSLYSKNRGIKPGNFYVLRNTKAIAVLVELGFITNEVDLGFILKNKNELSRAVVEGYFKLN